ncbi:hypothetical protein PAJ34TS1_31560 [Paenibacillus azoreducens]|uniref:Uncharacterized protein n=1 Tax=Paenibacillus azoreducens TaxID=116718 RepID=A0A919YA42_9BACL|nr:hypothetical protein J34TS1_17160 [Paenibacillus azoreducens]
MLAVNVHSHYLLTKRLLDILQESGPARVITVSGNPRFLKNSIINFDDIQMEHQYSTMRATSQSLFARTIFAFKLAKNLEGTGVNSNSFLAGGGGKIQSREERPLVFFRVAAPLVNARVKAECGIGIIWRQRKK